MLNWNDVIKYANHGNPTPDNRVEKSEVEWKSQLTPEEYRVTRQKGTEPRFSGEHCSLYEAGVYNCTCCDTVLFDSSGKFDSGTGWPSFNQPAKLNVIKYEKDSSLSVVRVEAMCNVCDSHLGHIFPDGPVPSGLRYCINSVSLTKSKI